MPTEMCILRLTGIERGTVAHALQARIEHLKVGMEAARKQDATSVTVLCAVDIETLERVLVKLGWPKH